MRQLREGGAPSEEIAKLVAGRDGDRDDFEIWPENADALRAFLFAETQWRVVSSPMGRAVWMGLDYGAVELAFRLHPPEHTSLEEAWWGVKVMEAWVLELRNRDADQQQ